MIPNIVRGRRVGGLLRYLYGPGRREEHRDPHLVAAWDGAGPLYRLEPSIGSGGRRDFRRLVDLLEQPVRNGRNPPAKPVWHCSVRTHPSDRGLTDGQWAHIAGEVMAGVGLAPHADPRAVRWVAIRHGADHVHIVATLVRQDRRTEYARNDRRAAQVACRDLEERYGLYRVGPPDRTAHRRPTAAELNKARRTGRVEPVRDRLRREVRFAAAASASVDEFFELLRQAEVLVEARVSTARPGQVTGYKVALADHTVAAGTPIWYGGGRLAPDLSLPRLLALWADTADAADGADGADGAGLSAGLYRQATEHVRAATADARAAKVAEHATRTEHAGQAGYGEGVGQDEGAGHATSTGHAERGGRSPFWTAGCTGWTPGSHRLSTGWTTAPAIHSAPVTRLPSTGRKQTVPNMNATTTYRTLLARAAAALTGDTDPDGPAAQQALLLAAHAGIRRVDGDRSADWDLYTVAITGRCRSYRPT